MAGLNATIRVQADEAKREIKDFNEQLKHSENILKLTTAELKANGDAAGILAAKKDSLNKQISIQTKITDTNNGMVEKSNKVLKEKEAELEKLKEKFTLYNGVLEDNDKIMLDLKASINKAAKEWAFAGKQVTKWNNDLEISEANGRLLSAKLQTLGNDVKGVGNAAEKSSNQMTKLFAAATAANVAADAITKGLSSITSGAQNYLNQASKAAEQFAVSQQQLTAIMQNNMSATDAQIGSIISLAEAYQRTGVVSQSVQLAGAQQLAMNVQQNETLEALLPLMNDLIAQQYGINATQQHSTRIARELGRAMGGNARTIERLGIAFSDAQMEIMKTGTETERLAVLLEVIPGRVHGINAALAETDVGRQAQLNNILQETHQRIGEVYNALRAEVSAEMLPAVEQLFTDLLRLVEENRDSISGLMGIMSGIVTFLVENAATVAAAIGGVGAAVTGLRLKAWASETIALAAAKTADTAATVAQTKANVAGTAAMTAKTKAVVLLKAAVMANPLLVGGLAIAAIVGVVYAISQASSALERASERVRELTDEFRRLESEADEIERNLNAVNQRIAEIRAQDTLSLMDEVEVERLERAADAYDRMLETAQRRADMAGVEASDAVIDVILPQIQRLDEALEDFYRADAALQAAREELENAQQAFDEAPNALFGRHAAERANLRGERDVIAERVRFLEAATNSHLRSISTARGAIDENSDALHHLSERYGETKDALDGVNESYAEHVRLLHERTIPGAASEDPLLDLLRAFRDGEIAADEYADALRELLDEKQRLANENPDIAYALAGDIAAIKEELERLSEVPEQLRTAYEQAAQSVADLSQAYRDGEKSGREYADALREMLADMEAQAKLNPLLAGQFNMLGDSIRQRLADSPEYLDNLRRSTSDLAREVDLLRNALYEQNEAGELSINTKLRLIESGYAAALVIDEETGKVRLCTDAYMALAEARIADHRAQLEMTRLELVRRLEEEEAAVNRVAQSHFSRAAAVLHAAQAYEISTDATREQIAAVEAQIAVSDRLANTVGTPAPRSGGGRGTDPNRERIQAWENYYREREEQMRTHLERERHFNRITHDEEVAAKDEILAFLQDRLADIDNLYWLSAEERVRITRDLHRLIDRYERQHFTLVRNNRLSDWERYYEDRERQTREWLERERFFGRLRFEDEGESLNEMLELLRQQLTEAEEMYELTADERANITRRLIDRIWQYERDLITAQRRETQEIHTDEERAANRRAELAQRDIDRAQSNEERYRAYAQMRVLINTQMYEQLGRLSEMHWENERDKMRAIEDAWWEHSRSIERVEDRMSDLRREHLAKQATEWRMAEMTQLDERRARLDAERDARRDQLNRELEMLREHFAELDALERRAEHGRKIGDLEEEAGWFSNAATRQGQQHYRRLREQIDRLRREDERENVVEQRRVMEDAIRAQISTVDEMHRSQLEEIDRQRDALQAKYEQMRDNAAKLAQDTVKGLMDAGEELTDGLTSMYDSFGENQSPKKVPS
ncbi:MAG: hypothetical protein FWF77_01710 [Defluviitaleaceae bacterium]|nr:hypothetical protein [Defluviitaleaceae bacterium]